MKNTYVKLATTDAGSIFLVTQDSDMAVCVRPSAGWNIGQTRTSVNRDLNDGWLVVVSGADIQVTISTNVSEPAPESAS